MNSQSEIVGVLVPQPAMLWIRVIVRNLFLKISDFPCNRSLRAKFNHLTIVTRGVDDCVCVPPIPLPMINGSNQILSGLIINQSKSRRLSLNWFNRYTSPICFKSSGPTEDDTLVVGRSIIRIWRRVFINILRIRGKVTRPICLKCAQFFNIKWFERFGCSNSSPTRHSVVIALKSVIISVNGVFIFNVFFPMVRKIVNRSIDIIQRISVKIVRPNTRKTPCQ